MKTAGLLLFIFFSPTLFAESGSKAGLEAAVSLSRVEYGKFEVTCEDKTKELATVEQILANRICAGAGEGGTFYDSQMRTTWKHIPGVFTINEYKCPTGYRVPTHLEVTEAVKRGISDSSINKAFGYRLSLTKRVLLQDDFQAIQGAHRVNLFDFTRKITISDIIAFQAPRSVNILCVR